MASLATRNRTRTPTIYSMLNADAAVISLRGSFQILKRKRRGRSLRASSSPCICTSTVIVGLMRALQCVKPIRNSNIQICIFGCQALSNLTSFLCFRVISTNWIILWRAGVPPSQVSREGRCSQSRDEQFVNKKWEPSHLHRRTQHKSAWSSP